MKKILSVFLSFVMIVSLLCVNASAATDKRPIYVSFGDSICAGWNLDGFDEGVSTNPEAGFRNFPSECYASIVGNALNYNTYNFALCGLDAPAFNDLLGGMDIYHAAESDFFYKLILGDYVEKNYAELLLGNTEYGKALKKASVISVNIGGNDFLSRLIANMMTMDESSLEALEAGLFVSSGNNEVDADATLSDMLQKLVNGGIPKEDIKAFISAFNAILGPAVLKETFTAAINGIKEVYPNIIRSLKKINPTAKIVVIGYSNVYSLEDLYTDIVTDIKDFVKNNREYSYLTRNLGYNLTRLIVNNQYASSIRSLNSYVENLCKNERLTFVDISAAPSPKTVDPHYDAKGHAFIADKLIDALTPVNYLYVSSTLGGSFKVSGASETRKFHTYSVKEGSSVVITPTALAGYEVKSVKANGKTVYANKKGEYLIGSLHGDLTVSVEFGKKAVKKTTVSFFGFSPVKLFR